MSLTVAVISCSSADPEAANPNDDGMSISGSAGSGGEMVGSGGSASPEGGGAAVCTGNPLPEPRIGQDFQSLNAKLVGPDGESAAADGIQVCGFDVCLLGKAGLGGAVQVDVSKTAIRGPAFKYGAGRRWAELAYALPDEPTFDFGEVAVLALPAMGTGMQLVAGATIESSGVRLNIAPATDIEVDVIAFEEGAQRAFRANAVTGFRSVAVPEDLGFEVVVGTTPIGTSFCPPASLTVPNIADWPAGASVELWGNGLDLEQRFAPYGGWGKLGDGEVSDDGSIVELNGAVPQLMTFGLRLKP